MAESDAGPRATGTVSTEEAERLSERFRPSWEDDPAEPPLSSAITRPLPVVSVTAGSKATVPKLAVADAPNREPPQPTLIGIAPEPSANASGAELDWEAPPKETPSSAAQTQRLPAVPLPVATAAGAPDSGAAEPEISIQIDVEEPPPASKPSGIGEKYVPKEEGAPPVVLNEDVKAAELGARAALEEQHRARRAPTILRMKAADIPVPAAPLQEDEDVPFAPRRSGGTAKLVVLGLVVTALAAASVIFLRGSGPPEAAPATAPATVAADTAAPPPPAPEPEKPLANASSTVPTVAPEAQSPPPEPAASSKEAHASATKASTAAARPAPAPKAAAAPKAGPVAAKPAPKTGTTKTSGKAAIVRDAPF